MRLYLVNGDFSFGKLLLRDAVKKGLSVEALL